MTAARILELAKEMQVSVGKAGLIVNRVNGKVPDSLLEEAKNHGLEVFGTVSIDDTVVDAAVKHMPASKLDTRSEAVQDLETILGSLGI
jgi:CO dehydrogenase nickel-insertion accessory protein CooC1